ncbi:MAG: flagellar hook-length control protein FliK [Defluviitaleaceae bacterium]|nr:flagellar hook-length control protein FliK [Defluviitaleaceae bacterium]
MKQLSGMMPPVIGADNAQFRRTARPAGGGDFDAIFAQANATPERQHEQPERQPIQTEQPAATNNQPRPDADAPPETYGVAQNGDEAQEVYEAAEIADDSPEYAIIIEDEIAEILDIPAEMAAAIMADMEIYPEDLADPQIKLEYIAKAYGADEGAGLLAVENALPILEAVGEIIDKYIAQKPTEIYVPKEQAAMEITDTTEIPVEVQAGFAEVLEGETISEFVAKNVETAEVAEVAVEDDLAEVVRPIVENAAEQNIVADNSAISPDFNPMQGLDNFTSAVEAAITAEAQFQSPINPQNVIDQIVENMRFETRGPEAEIRITLKPEHLGDLTMRIATINGTVTAMFLAESQRIKEIIESQFNALRDALNAQGLQVAEIEVSVSNGDSAREDAEFGKNISGARVMDLMEQFAENPEPQFDEEGAEIPSLVNIKA